MSHMIDLVPYLPANEAQERSSRKENRYKTITAAVESIVTLAIGAGFFFGLAAFLSAI